MAIVKRKYNAKKICFISCVNNEEKYKILLTSIEELRLPNGFKYELLPVRNAASIFEGYQWAMEHTDAKYKIYVHQDVTFYDKNFLINLIRAFKEHPRYGIIGTVGGLYLDYGRWWHGKMAGAIIDNSVSTGLAERRFFEDGVKNTEVAALDGLLLATQYDVDWRIDLFDGWHYYDLSQCMEFRRAGYLAVALAQPTTACIHDCGTPSMDGFDDARYIFLKEYNKEIAAINNAYEKPLVTVIIPTYNRPEYLAMAIESVIAQTYTNWELFISDNSPNEKTKNMMQHYLHKYSNIKYEYHPELDFYGNWKVCQEYDNPNAEFINYLMDDDVFLPEKLDTMIRVYMHNPDVSLVTSRRLLIDENNDILPDVDKINGKLSDNDIKAMGQYAGKAILTKWENFIGEPTTALIKKSSLRDGNLLGWSGTEGNYLVTDYPTWLQCMSKGNLYYVAEPMSCFRQHAGQDTFSSRFAYTVPICMAIELKYAIENEQFLSTEEEILKSLDGVILTTANVIEKYRSKGVKKYADTIQLLKKVLSSVTNAVDNNFYIDLSFL